MVASDTVVGLVGAGILLVALVGVFVYESQQGGSSDAELQNLSSEGRAKGTATLRDQTPTQPSAAQCQMLGAACTPGARTVDLTVSGLPLGHGACYVAFLQSSTASQALGNKCMDLSGNDYKVAQTSNMNGVAYNKITISLETSSGASSPTNTICSFPVATGSIDQACKVDLMGMTGNHTLSFVPDGGGTNVTAKLSQVPQRSGFTYRGWLLAETDAGENWTFVGNFTAAGNAMPGKAADGNITGVVDGAKNDYTMFAVTLEPTNAKIGTMPAGPEVIMAHYNPREVMSASAVP